MGWGSRSKPRDLPEMGGSDRSFIGLGVVWMIVLVDVCMLYTKCVISMSSYLGIPTIRSAKFVAMSQYLPVQFGVSECRLDRNKISFSFNLDLL